METQAQSKDKKGMNMMTNRVLGAGMAAVALASSLWAADPLADAKWAWHFDRDINGDGVVDKEDIRDIRDWGSTNDLSYVGIGRPSAVSGPYGNKEPCRYMYWNNDGVVAPLKGVKGEVPCLDMCWRTNELGKSLSRGFKMASAVRGSITVFARLKMKTFSCNGKGDTSTPGWLISNGFGGSATGKGLGLALSRNGKYGSEGTFRVLGGGIDYEEPSVTLAKDTWYDVAWSIKDNGDNTAEGLFVVAGETGKVSKVMLVQTVTKHFTSAFTVAADGAFQVGGFAAVDRTSGLLSDGDTQAFNGYLARLYVWNRALDRDEIMRVMTQPRPIFELGVANSSGKEFGRVDETKSTFEVGRQPMHDLPQALTMARNELTLKLPVYEKMDEYVVPYLFELVAATNFAGSAEVDVAINGTSLGNPQSLAAGGNASWYVKPECFTDKAHPSLTIRRIGGTADELVLDKLSLTGSFAMGTDDLTVEMVGGVADTYVGMRNPGKIGRGPSNGKNYRDYCFYVSESQSAHAYTFYSRPVDFGSGAQALYILTNDLKRSGYRFPFKVSLNGNKIYETPPEGILNKQAFSVKIPKGGMVSGWNKFTVTMDGIPEILGVNGWWTGFDYFRLAIHRPPQGLLLMVK